MSVWRLATFCLLLSSRAEAKRKRAYKEASETIATFAHDYAGNCSEAVEGAVKRNSAWRRWKDTCKCPLGTALSGNDPLCTTGRDDYDRYFGVAELKGKGCSCVDRECGVETVDVEEVLPATSRAKNREVPVVVGTKGNIKTGIPLDFTGIWWMRNNAVPEELVSFAGMTANTSGAPWFPADVKIPNSLRNMWAWDDSVLAHIIKAYYSYTMDHSFQMTITMWNETYGEIETALKDIWPISVKKWAIIKLNEDEWLRPTTFKDESWFSDANYTLTRVVYANGEPHPENWPAFVAHMGERKLRVFDSDDKCRRTCRLTGGDCRYCAECCGDHPGSAARWCPFR